MNYRVLKAQNRLHEDRINQLMEDIPKMKAEIATMKAQMKAAERGFERELGLLRMENARLQEMVKK